MSETLSKLFMQVSKRSEKISQETLIKSFVDVGPLFSVMDTIDNQIFYGRRGTGKTHALIYLSRTVQDRNDIPVYIDLRSIGSTAGIYADGTLPLPERSTRLLMDMLSSVHDGLVNAALDESVGLNLSKMGPVLDELAEAITEVVVTGEVVEEVGLEDSSRTSASESVGLKASNKSISTEYGSRETKEDSTASHKSSTTKGVISHRVNFGRVGSLLSSLTKEIEGKRIWLLLDEWSAVPIELQPYLADLIRRAIFPAANITVKIAAIENRSKFQIPLEGGDYIGIELGGDASADFNMDDFMVFDNDEEQAIQFFKTLIFRHIETLASAVPDAKVPSDENSLINVAFTQENVFREFVRAAEGIPRDAFCILSLAAQKDFGKPISMDTIKNSSKTWYQRDKESAVSTNQGALKLLHYIIDEVIGHRKARAFLIKRGESHVLVDSLFDSRVLHLLKKNISAHDQPGVRYDVYKIDYGCYVDLLTTAKAPGGLINQDVGGYIDVPPDDYRAIRRAILDLSRV